MITKIIGTGSSQGRRRVSNQDLEQVVETSDEWIHSRTGISSRYVTEGEGIKAMAAEAAEKACIQAGISPKEVELILVATSTT